MIASVASRLSQASGSRPILLAVMAAVIAGAAVMPSGVGPVAARAVLAAAAIAAALALARRRARAAPAAAPLSIVAQAPLGRDAGIAVVAFEGRRILVGFGPEGVRLLEQPGAGEVKP